MGRFSYGSLAGQGTDIRADGSVLGGRFAKGLLQGFGQATSPNGDTSSGNFEDSSPQGHGVMVYAGRGTCWQSIR
jgi:hypothetical protein